MINDPWPMINAVLPAEPFPNNPRAEKIGRFNTRLKKRKEILFRAKALRSHPQALRGEVKALRNGVQALPAQKRFDAAQKRFELNPKRFDIAQKRFEVAPHGWYDYEMTAEVVGGAAQKSAASVEARGGRFRGKAGGEGNPNHRPSELNAYHRPMPEPDLKKTLDELLAESERLRKQSDDLVV